MTDADKEQLQNFLRAVQQYIGRDLSPPEALALATVFPSLQGRPTNAGNAAGDFVSQARQRAGQALDVERQRVNDTMNSTLRALGAVPAQSPSAQEGSALELLNKTTSMQQLQQAGQIVAATGKSADDAPAIVKIVDRLMVLVKDEVERCFQEQFGQLNQQMATTLQQLKDWMAQQQPKTDAAAGDADAGSMPAVPETPVPETAVPEPVVPEPVVPEPVVPEPVVPEPVVPEPVVPEPVVPEAVVPESAEDGAATTSTDVKQAGK